MLPRKQQEVHDLADGGHGVSMLGDPHGPTDDDAARGHDVVDELLDVGRRAMPLSDSITGHVDVAPTIARLVESVAVRSR